ncbi:MAG: hypothetical protein AAFP23_05795 [Pseudomonadota bacterium]
MWSDTETTGLIKSLQLGRWAAYGDAAVLATVRQAARTVFSLVH